MKSFFPAIVLAWCIGIAILVGCSPEQEVSPKGTFNTGPTIAFSGNTPCNQDSLTNNQHPQPNPPCGPGIKLPLVDSAGSLIYAFNNLPYGEVSMLNDENIVWIGVNLNPSLFSDLSAWYVGAVSAAPTSSNGNFDLENFPFVANFPRANVWNWSTCGGGIGYCGDWVVYLEVFRSTFFGGEIAGTRLGLWASGTSLNNGYTFEFCQDICNVTTVTGGECRKCDSEVTVDFQDCYCVEISSCKDLSNVVIEYTDGSRVKYDNLTGKDGKWCSPDQREIATVWVKSGCYKSGDGPGYGRRFDGPCAIN